MDLFLIRHGYAEGLSADVRTDGARALTEIGEKLLLRAGPGMKSAGIAPSIILSSPYLRARQTADILQETLNSPQGVHVLPSLASGASPGTLLEIAVDHQVIGPVMIVGHNPEMDAISRLLAARADAPIQPALPGTLAWFRHGGTVETQSVKLIGQWDLESWTAN
jgi:phosphohistidine phosphatase